MGDSGWGPLVKALGRGSWLTAFGEGPCMGVMDGVLGRGHWIGGFRLRALREGPGREPELMFARQA